MEEEQLNQMKRHWQVLACKGRPTGRHETAFVECGGMFYLIGGREAEGRIDQLDPDTRSWRQMEAQSPLIHHFQPVVWGNMIYMVGAMTGGYPTEPPMERIQIYDPETDAWSEGGGIPKARRRGGSGAVVYDGKIYVACGITYGHTEGTNNWFDAYDPETDTWTELEDAPRIRDHFHAVAVNDRMYCIGGETRATTNQTTSGLSLARLSRRSMCMTSGQVPGRLYPMPQTFLSDLPPLAWLFSTVRSSMSAVRLLRLLYLIHGCLILRRTSGNRFPP